MLHQHLARTGHDLDGAVGRDQEGLVVAAVFLSGLSHQANVGHRAHGDRIKRAIDLAVGDRGLVDPGVAGIRDQGDGVGLGAIGAPHVT